MCNNVCMKLHWDAIVFAGIELAILVNLVVLDIALFGQSRPASPQATVVATSSIPATGCNEECKQQIDRAVATALASLPSPSQVAPQKQTVSPTSQSTKEFYVPFGSGTTQNDQWEDVPGVVSYIDTNNYTNIQTVYFEVSMNIPTKNGIVSARLYNATDKHPVWYSEVSTDSNVSKLVATKVKLDSGNKQYQVQMKTSLRYASILDFARIKILTK